MFVYFIQSGKKGAIKIGKSNDPEDRLKTLQTGSPKTLYLIASIHCKSEQEAYTLEKKIHNKLCKQRLNGEWFRPNIYLTNVGGDKRRKIKKKIEGFIDEDILSHMSAIMTE